MLSFKEKTGVYWILLSVIDILLIVTFYSLWFQPYNGFYTDFFNLQPAFISAIVFFFFPYIFLWSILPGTASHIFSYKEAKLYTPSIFTIAIMVVLHFMILVPFSPNFQNILYDPLATTLLMLLVANSLIVVVLDRLQKPITNTDKAT